VIQNTFTLSSTQESINAFSARVSFPSEWGAPLFSGVEDALSHWIQAPQVHPDQVSEDSEWSELIFSAVIPGGYQADSPLTLFSLTWEAPEASDLYDSKGDLKLTTEEWEVYAQSAEPREVDSAVLTILAQPFAIPDPSDPSEPSEAGESDVALPEIVAEWVPAVAGQEAQWILEPIGSMGTNGASAQDLTIEYREGLPILNPWREVEALSIPMPSEETPLSIRITDGFGNQKLVQLGQQIGARTFFPLVLVLVGVFCFIRYRWKHRL
jgi:hypothetical protein